MEEAVKRVPASAGEGAVATAGAGVERSAAPGTAEEAVAAIREAAEVWKPYRRTSLTTFSPIVSSRRSA